jgi:hypothetical protein
MKKLPANRLNGNRKPTVGPEVPLSDILAPANLPMPAPAAPPSRPVCSVLNNVIMTAIARHLGKGVEAVEPGT